LRLRPIGLALRATPSAPVRWLRGIPFMGQPPLLCDPLRGGEYVLQFHQRRV